MCTNIWQNLAPITCIYTQSVTQLYLNFHLTWVLEQLDMYVSWHKFYYESTFALIGILTYVLKNTFCQ